MLLSAPGWLPAGEYKRGAPPGQVQRCLVAQASVGPRDDDHLGGAKQLNTGK